MTSPLLFILIGVCLLACWGWLWTEFLLDRRDDVAQRSASEGLRAIRLERIGSEWEIELASGAVYRAAAHREELGHPDWRCFPSGDDISTRLLLHLRSEAKRLQLIEQWSSDEARPPLLGKEDRHG